MMVNSHDEALDLQTALLGAISRPITSQGDPRFGMRSMAVTSQMYMHMFAKHPDRTQADVIKEVNGIISSLLASGSLQKSVRELIELEKSTLVYGDTVYVSADVCAEISEASESMIDTVIIPQDVFSTCCLIVLGKPMEYVVPQSTITNNENDVSVEYEERWEISAISLRATSDSDDIVIRNPGSDAKTEGGLILQIYGSLKSVGRHNPDGSHEKAEFLDANSLRYTDNSGSRVMTRSEAADTLGGNIVEFMDRFANRLDFVDMTALNYYRNNDGYAQRIAQLKTFLIALFRLSGEYLEMTNIPAGKPFRKRAIRGGRSEKTSGYITTLRMRRNPYGYHDSGDGTGPRPTFSFRVRGHWKRAYMRSRGFPVGDPRSYKHIYVKDYIKGKAHGDVVESHRLVRVDR